VISQYSEWWVAILLIKMLLNDGINCMGGGLSQRYLKGATQGCPPHGNALQGGSMPIGLNLKHAEGVIN